MQWGFLFVSHRQWPSETRRHASTSLVINRAYILGQTTGTRKTAGSLLSFRGGCFGPAGFAESFLSPGFAFSSFSIIQTRIPSVGVRDTRVLTALV